MRKRIIPSVSPQPAAPDRWLDLERAAQVEVTSENPSHPVESALLPGRTGGWRAADPGLQTLRLIFDVPLALRHIQLVFTEADIARTQEFVIRYLAAGESREIVRQQWTFSPHGSTHEQEDYRVQLSSVAALELTITPDIGGGPALASLAALRLLGD